MVDVLLLNASYEPLAVIPWRRALSLLARGRVDAATTDSVTIHSVSQAMRVPTVLRLRHYVNVPRRGAGWSRQGVFQRDRYHCIYCGIQPSEWRSGRQLTRRDFTIDHIIPRSRGGRNTWGNTACACFACNHRKGDRTPHEAGMVMRWEPKIPRVDYLVAYGEIPDSWKVYLELG
ncbi:MAG: HNH endonuclease [Chloroflexi bacterium]|nr:HNH endonuclease [Chloroflexota bacterium]MCI0577407.1 HNH endonuclease [Chloroflexota bacterium]MCI0649607.1 HNH endonuclease [Chloroflexota bacterium]MCI0725375.1 HNH endonuclease [Chloroflexota bacterium]